MTNIQLVFYSQKSILKWVQVYTFKITIVCVFYGEKFQSKISYQQRLKKCARKKILNIKNKFLTMKTYYFHQLNLLASTYQANYSNKQITLLLITSSSSYRSYSPTPKVWKDCSCCNKNSKYTQWMQFMSKSNVGAFIFFFKQEQYTWK